VNRPATAGFTLVEVLVAMGITALIGALVAGSFVSVDRANRVVADQGDRYGASRVALTRMARELSMAFLSDHYDTTQYREPLTVFIGKEESVLFASLAHERLWLDARESDQMVVEYTLDDDPKDRDAQALFRREKVRIDNEPDRGGRKDLVADHVLSIRFRYFDPKKNEWVREWSSKGTDHPKELPSRVQIELETKLSDGRKEKFVTEARIAMTKALDF